MFSRINSTIFSFVFIVFFVVNTFLLKEPFIGLILGVLFILLVGNALATVLPASETNQKNWWFAVWIIFSLIMLIGSVAYYIAYVPAVLFQSIALVTIVLSLWKTKIPNLPISLHTLRRISKPVWIAIACTVLFLGLFFSFTRSHQIFDAVRSPWDRIHPSILLLFAVVSVLVFTMLYRGRERIISLLLFFLLLGTILFFAVQVYPIGYGFDSFIHQATESHLAEFGTITPKPFYYIGQYTLILFFSHAFSLPIVLVDTFLLPLLTVILLPLAWFSSAVSIIKKPRPALFTLVGIFLLPLETFIVTTPQSLANLWILLAILASVPILFQETTPKKNKIIWGGCFLGAIATILIHPISGIPIFLYFCLLALTSISTRAFFWIVAVVSALALPASFLLNAIKSGQAIHFNIGNLRPLQLLRSLNLKIFFQNRFNPLLDFVYVFGQNRLLIVLLLSVVIFWIYRKDLTQRIRIIFIMIIILGINYLLLSNLIDFSFLIDYERANYASRLIPLIIFFLCPLIILALGHLSINMRTRPIVLKISVLILFSVIASSSFYLAFPRRDAYTTSHAFNVSRADVDAIYLVENWAGGKPYIALANQSVSAAAIKNIGFRYYDNLFFYPIPTGEGMYKKFLAMNESPNKKIVQESLNLISPNENVHTLFYVVDSYWWEANRIIETAKNIADDWKSVGNGSVYVFRFDE